MKYYLLSCLFLIVSSLKAQEELSLFFHPDVVQSGLLQPAYETCSNVAIGIGSSYLHLDFRGPKLKNFSIQNAFLAGLASSAVNTYLSTDASFNYYDVGFKYKDWFFRTGYNANTNLYFNLSPDFAKLFVQGNGNNVGKKLDFGPDLFLRQTAELYIGASLPIYEFYRLGVNLKFISGNFDISTPKSELSLTTGDEIYELTLENDYLLNASYNSLEFSIREFIPFSSPFQDNMGVSADFGFQFLSEKWDVSASLLDVGFIRWRSNVVNVRGEGEYTFNGFKFSEITIDTLQQLGDTLLTVFNVDVSNNAYSTFAPLKIVVGGEYHINKVHLGAVLYGEWKQNRFIPALGVNVRRRIRDFWDIGASYSIKNGTYSNLGLSSVMNLGPFQFYALSDNVIGPFLPSTSRKFNLRIGINLQFGKFKRPQQAIPKSHTASL